MNDFDQEFLRQRALKELDFILVSLLKTFNLSWRLRQVNPDIDGPSLDELDQAIMVIEKEKLFRMVNHMTEEEG